MLKLNEPDQVCISRRLDYDHDDPNPTLIQHLSGDTAGVGPPHGHGPVSFLMIFRSRP